MYKANKILTLTEQYRRILAIGDMHGCVHHLRALLAAVQPTKDDLIVTLGDYIDRGPDSKGVLDILIGLYRDQEINIVSLRGNHDALMLLALDASDETKCGNHYDKPSQEACDSDTVDAWDIVAYKEPAQIWWGNQGMTTLASYCRTAEQKERLQTVDGWVRWPKDYHAPLRDLMAELIPQEHIDFLRDTCVDAIETDSHIFVHGGLCPELPLADQPLFALHWTRFDKAWKPHISGKKVVCGHTPQPDLLVHDLGHAVCLDTGVYMAKGFLACMDVLSGQTWQIDNDLQLIQQPVVRYEGGKPFVQISDLPEEERERFQDWLLSRSMPFDGCAWPWDYSEWQGSGKP